MRSAEAARELPASPRQVGVLHGDVHHGNVLHFGERGWLAIDSKGLLGERAFDYANLFCNPDRETATAPDRFARRLFIVCHPIAASFADERSKEHSITVVRMLAVASGAVAVIHRAEAWLVAGDLPGGLTPSQSDRRIEVLVLTAQARLKGKLVQKVSVREIVRDDNGQPTGLRDVSTPKGDGSLHGPMTDMLPPRAPTAEQRAMASVILQRMQQSDEASPLS